MRPQPPATAPATATDLCQAVGLHLLDALGQACSTHGLTYHLAGGTLLGALRHEGFIPWDDDVDITMPREDFEHLRRLASAEPELFGFGIALSVGADHVGRLVLLASASGRGPLLLDIFPVDPVPAPALLRITLTSVFWLVKTMESVTWGDWQPAGSRQRRAASVLRAVAKPLGRRRFDSWVESLRAVLADRADGALCNLLVARRPVLRTRRAAWFAGHRTAIFEGRELPIPLGAEAVLEEAYGADWRRPPSTPGPVHFPPPIHARLGERTWNVQ